MSDLIGDIKVVIINMSTELKETMIKEVKEGIMTVTSNRQYQKRERNV